MHLNAKLVSLFLNSNQILIPVKLYSIFVTLEVGKKLKWSHLNQKITYLTRIGTGFEYKQTNKQKKSYSKNICNLVTIIYHFQCFFSVE